MKKIILILGIFCTVVFLQVLFSPLFDKLELITYDFRSRIAIDDGAFSEKMKPADKNVVLVVIDDYSRNQIANNPQLGLGSWPWRRDTWAKVVKFIEKGEPKAVLFDLIFNDVNDNYYYDRRLASTFRRYDNIVLATSLGHPKALIDKYGVEGIALSDALPTSKPLDVEIDDKSLDNKITYFSHAPVQDRYTNYNTMGVVNKVVKEDSVVRSSQPIFKLIKGDETYYMPSLSFAGFLKAVGEDGKIVIKNKKIFYKGRTIPLNDDATTYVSWHGLGKNYDYVPVSMILLNEGGEKDLQPEFFKDKVVVIGRTEAGTDIHPAAVNPSYTGPEVNATVIDNFINDTDPQNKGARKFITKLSANAEYAIIAVFCAIIGWIGWTSASAMMGFLNSSMLVLFYFLMCVFAFVNPSIRIWVPIVVPMYYILITSAIVYSYRLQGESAKKAQVMNMFGKFVSPKVLANLMKDKESLVLKNTKKHITIMFCDVKDFTSLSEKCDPEELMSGLNELFNEIVNIIFENNGTVDKFVGDCVMAYWGDPISSDEDAFMAIKTALAIKKKVGELKVENTKAGKLTFDVKIGINTGDALLGLAGSDKIMSYTAMGDVVNVASRLESSCSRMKRDVLISKATYSEVKDKVIVLEVGKIDVKGKDELIEIYEPIGFVEKPSQEK